MRFWAPLLLCAAAPGCAARQEERTLWRAEQLLAESRPRRGDLMLSCTPGDAEVVVDGVPRGACTDFPSGLRLGEGMHQIEVKKDGFRPYQTYYEASGARATVEVSLSPLGKTEGASP